MLMGALLFLIPETRLRYRDKDPGVFKAARGLEVSNKDGVERQGACMYAPVQVLLDRSLGGQGTRKLQLYMY